MKSEELCQSGRSAARSLMAKVRDRERSAREGERRDGESWTAVVCRGASER